MGICKSKNGHSPPLPPIPPRQQQIYVSILQGNKSHAYLLAHQLTYDFANIYVRYAQWYTEEPCDFVIFVKNGTHEQNLQCHQSHDLDNKKYFVLPELPDTYDNFKSYVYLFAKIYLFGEAANHSEDHIIDPN